eukprot:GFUD01023846.1.p1 GENE.GFUD01023846.1~~GFUD01023846.1.p1  ORF type:complete len:360 (+),score=86.19 GFUD01023846.1:63-1142(+)
MPVLNGSRARSLDTHSFKSGSSGYSKASVNASQAMGGVLANILSSLLMLLSTPILIFGGFILIYFYHVQSFSVVSEWFYVLPYAFFSCGVINLFNSVIISIFQAIAPGVGKTFLLIILSIFLIVSCILNGISAYGCSELQSIILQQSFLSVDTGSIMDQYMNDHSFQSAWDNLQRQFFCCGTLLFNNGFFDWKFGYGKLNNSVPDSCCHEESFGCGSHIFDGSLPPMKIYTHGCLTVIQSKLESELTSLLLVFMTISLSVMLISLICLVLSLCTANTRPEMEHVTESSSVIGHYQPSKIVADTDHVRVDGSSVPMDWGEQMRPYRHTHLPPTNMESRGYKDRTRNKVVDLYTTQVSSEV